jgi:hypothetical protein
MNTETGIRTRSDVYNKGTKDLQQIHEEVNTVQNYAVLVKAMKDGRARDINDEPKANKAPCIVIGSGGSLDDAMPLLKDWKGGIVCSTSHARTLMYYGIEPSHIMMLDPFCFWDEISGVDWSKTRTKMVAHPGIWPDVIANWPNEILLYIQNNGRRDSFYATTQKHMYSNREGKREAQFTFMIRTEMTVFACSPAMEMFVAGILDYGKIFLSGVDFGYVNGKERFTDYSIENGVWTAHPHPYEPAKPAQGGTVCEPLMSSNGIPTETIHVYYKKNMISAWRLSGQEVYTTDKGIITEIPYVPMKRVVKMQGAISTGLPEAKRMEKAIHEAEKYLAGVGAFVLQSSHGLSFVESEKPDIDLPNYMNAMSARLRCRQCGAEGPMPADGKLEGFACPICGQKDVTKEVAVDIGMNMDRIRALLKEVDAERKTR